MRKDRRERNDEKDESQGPRALHAVVLNINSDNPTGIQPRTPDILPQATQRFLQTQGSSRRPQRGRTGQEGAREGENPRTTQHPKRKPPGQKEDLRFWLQKEPKTKGGGELEKGAAQQPQSPDPGKSVECSTVNPLICLTPRHQNHPQEQCSGPEESQGTCQGPATSQKAAS